MAVDFATFDDLTRFTNNLTLNEQRSIKTAAFSQNNQDTFLSHSSKDAQYLPGVIKLLKNHGASVYCDLEDERLPNAPTPETANIIKKQIKSCTRLVVFITTNSKESKWVPWELGIGDTSLSPKNVALLPVADFSFNQDWAKQEYLGLYRHIVYGEMKNSTKPLWMVYDYRNNTATSLRNWCQNSYY